MSLDPKLARIDKHLYTDAAPETWHRNVRTFLIGRHVDMKPFLTWIEARGTRKITEGDLTSMRRVDGVMIDFDPVQAAQELSSWLNPPLEKSATAQRTFHKVEELNGAEVYRRLVVPLGLVAPSITRRNALRDKIQQPIAAKSMTTIMDAVEVYEANMLAFCKAGGTEPADDERRAQLMKLLPANTSMENMQRADEQTTAEELIEWFRRKSIFVSEHGGKDGGAHITEQVPPPLPIWTYNGDDPELQAFYNGDDGPPDREHEDLTEEDVSAMNDAELLAFVRGGGGFRGGTKGGFRKGKGKERQWFKREAKTRGEPPPRGAGDLRCINCGGTGHGWRACTKPECPRELRPCLNCGKPGHMLRDCKAPKAALALEGGKSAAASGVKPQYALVCRAEVASDSEARVRGRPYAKV